MSDKAKYNRLDYALSHLLSKRTPLNGQQKKDFEGLCAKLSFQQSQGHSCIHLDKDEKTLVHASGLLSTKASAPIVFEKGRLYLHRYWFYENRLAEQVKRLCKYKLPYLGFESILDRYFTEPIDEIDWQREAAKKCINQSFVVISGGPGTGKTTTVVKILALLQELAVKQETVLHIALAAPTGKAAARLQESIGLSKAKLPCGDYVKQKIPETVFTVHRLLGSQAMSPYFKHHSGNILSYDLVVIDEASMIDLALMSKLVDALKPNSRLILLGDKNQLVSVESGAVLADITIALPEQTVELKKSFRFKGNIKSLADAVNNQRVNEAWAVLEKNEDVGLLEENLIDFAVKKYTIFFQSIKNNADFQAIFLEFNRFQILCSNRYGEKGAVDINRSIEEKLSQQGMIQKNSSWYIGRPVMIVQNNVAMGLYNGDVGICLYDEDITRISVFFKSAGGGRVKKFLPSTIPPHETVFAMTIHKSQGSEFEECLCVLPEKMNPVLSKELIYTAITRAKKVLKISACHSIFSQALQKKIVRTSGLAEKLKQ